MSFFQNPSDLSSTMQKKFRIPGKNFAITKSIQLSKNNEDLETYTKIGKIEIEKYFRTFHDFS